MLTAIVLVCSMLVTPELRDCDTSNAVSVLQVPESFGNPMTCFLHGEAYLAGTSLGRDLHDDERIKVACVQTHKLPPNHKLG